MAVKVTDNTAFVKEGINRKANIFLRTAADEVVKVAKKNTPKKSGRLRNDILRQVLGLKGKIKWGKNYAIYQETKRFRNYTTPGTGPHFAENAVKEVVRMTGIIARRVGLT